MTRTELHVAIAERVRDEYAGTLAFYDDATAMQTAPDPAGFIVLDVAWGRLQQESRLDVTTALFLQPVAATFSIHVPREAGIGTAYAEAEAISGLFRNRDLGAGELQYLSERDEDIPRGADDPDPFLEYHLEILFERASVLAVPA